MKNRKTNYRSQKKMDRKNKHKNNATTSDGLNEDLIEEFDKEYLTRCILKENEKYWIELPKNIVIGAGVINGQYINISLGKNDNIILTPITCEAINVHDRVMQSLKQIGEGDFRTDIVTYIDPETVSSEDIDLSLLHNLSDKNRSEILEIWACSDLKRKMSENNRFKDSILRLWYRNNEKYKAKYYEEYSDIIDNCKAKEHYEKGKK